MKQNVLHLRTNHFCKIYSKPTQLYPTKIQAVKSVALKLSTFGIQTGYNNLSGVPASYLLKSWRDIPSDIRQPLLE